jgi:hypothetical protein
MTEPQPASSVFMDLSVAFLAPMFRAVSGGDIHYARAAEPFLDEATIIANVRAVRERARAATAAVPRHAVAAPAPQHPASSPQAAAGAPPPPQPVSPPRPSPPPAPRMPAQPRPKPTAAARSSVASDLLTSKKNRFPALPNLHRPDVAV